MIKIEHIVTPSPEQMKFVIEGMRNPLESWDKSDSTIEDSIFKSGDRDLMLMKKLCNAGSDERKFMRQMSIMVRITAPLYWWKEFDTYKVGTVSNSCSTMHKIHSKPFTIDDFSHEHILDWEAVSCDTIDEYEYQGKGQLIRDMYCVIDSGKYIDYGACPREYMDAMLEMLNHARTLYLKTKDKKYWWQIIQLLPSSYNQTRNVSMNYENLRNIYKARKNHKLDEWRTFCETLANAIPYSFLIYM